MAFAAALTKGVEHEARTHQDLRNYPRRGWRSSRRTRRGRHRTCVLSPEPESHRCSPGSGDLRAIVSRVALFVNDSASRIESILKQVQVDTLQFHGDETPEFCNSFGLPYVKSIGVKPGLDVAAAMASYGGASAVLLDQHDRVQWGGTGEAFDWALVPGERHRPMVLAGGLTPDNVCGAIRQVKPDAIDVSGGVEREKGIKDAALIAAFMRGVNRVSASE